MTAVVFLPVLLFIKCNEIERKKYREWAKQKLSERAMRRDEHLQTLMERGNIDDVSDYLALSYSVDAIISTSHDDLLGNNK